MPTLVDPSLGTNPDQYNALLTSTLGAYRKTLVDNFSDATPFTWWLSQNERKKYQRGGTHIDIPLMYAGVDVQPFSGFQKLNTEPAEGIAPATALWKKYQVPIVISKDHETENMGEAQIISLVEAKVRQAEISFREELNYDLINNGLTGTSGDSSAVPDNLRVTGLTDMLQDATNARVYEGIGGSSYSWWKNTFDTSVNFTNATSDGIEKMRSVYLTCSRGQDRPDLILTSQDGYENYDALLVDQKRFVNTMAADAGFESLMYRGSTILFDRDVPSDFMFFLNSTYLELTVHPDVDMHHTPFREAENQWARFSRIMWKGQLCCTNRKRQGLLNGVTST